MVNYIEGSKNTKNLVLTALLFAIAIVLSVLENMLPPFITSVQGIKLGLSNIVVMYSLFFLKKRQAFLIAILKALFVFITRGVTAGFLSLIGGILSLVIMIILMIVFKDKITYLIISVFGAIFHNIGQYIAVTIIYGMQIWAYLPVLLISGLIAGIITSTLLKFIMPAFKKVGLK